MEPRTGGLSLGMAALAASLAVGCQCGSTPSTPSDHSGPKPAAVHLSILEPHPGGCIWLKKDVQTQASERLATLSADCSRGEIAWSSNREAAVLSFGEPDLGLAAWTVDLQAAIIQPQRLPIPEPGSVSLLAMDERGVIGFGLVRQVAEFRGPDRQPMLRHGGELVPGLRDGPGLHAMAQALRPKENNWEVIAAQPTRCCAPGAAGLTVLEDASILADTMHSTYLLSRTPRGDPIADPAFLAELNPLLYQDDRVPPDTNGRWHRIRSESWAYDLAIFVTERPQPRGLGLARMLHEGAVQSIPDWPFGRHDLIAIQLHGPYLLASDAFTGARPVVYDMRKGRVAYATSVGHGAVFWPESPQDVSK